MTDWEFIARRLAAERDALLNDLAEALRVVDHVNGCHGCLDNGSSEDEATVKRLRQPRGVLQLPDEVPT